MQVLRYSDTDIFPKKYYDPAKGDPKIPTASSAQIRNNTNNIAPQMIILFFMVFTFLRTSSQANAVVNNRNPITVKSKISQSTSLVNCMAMSGISNSTSTEASRMNNLVFFMIVYLKEL